MIIVEGVEGGKSDYPKVIGVPVPDSHECRAREMGVRFTLPIEVEGEATADV